MTLYSQFKRFLLSSLLGLCLSAIGLSFSGLAYADTDYSRLVVFGDSLSDAGNLASVTNDLPYPFYMNRITNGPTAVDTLAQQLGLSSAPSLHLIGSFSGDNYAVARATAGGSDAISLTTQVTSFLAINGFQADPEALYVFFIGGNDVRDAAHSMDPELADTMINQAITSIQQSMASLEKAGAATFLVINAPNIGIIPETRLIEELSGITDLKRSARKISKQFSSELHAMLSQMEDESELEIIEFNLFKFFNKLIKHADRYGFTNTQDGCFSSVNFSFHPLCDNGQNFDQFIFFDEIHPTARVHELTGQAIYQQLIKSDDD